MARFAAATPPALVDRVLVDRAPESLHAFMSIAFKQVEPAREFVDGRVVHVVAEHLEAVSKGEIKRLIINIPPGFMKSLTVGVFWPVWDWIVNQDVRWIYGSYDPSLTLRDARKAYNLIQSRWFVERWGRVLPRTKQPIGDYFTRQGGNRFSTSVRGRATGRHFDRHVADDPIKPRDALGGASFSEATLEECDQWWNQTIATRASDYENVARVIVMQRLHSGDLAGRCIERGGYTVLALPMRFEPKYACAADWRTLSGELLWPERFPEAACKQIESDLGSQAAIASQLQQRPTPRGGLIFKESDLRYWHPLGREKLDPNGKPCIDKPLERAGVWFQSWDLTFKDNDGSDYVCGGTFQGIGNQLFLHNRVRARLGFDATCKAIRDMTRDYPRTMRKLIENKANGPAVENTLKQEVSGIVLVEPQGGKVARANACQVHFERGLIVLPHPELAPWVMDQRDGLVKELTSFPFGQHDDQVDMLTQAVIDYYTKRNRLAEAMRAMGKQL